MMFFPHGFRDFLLSIRGRMVLVYGVLFVASFLAVSAYFLHVQGLSLTETAHERGNYLAASLALSAGEAVRDRDFPVLNDLIRQAVNIEDVRYALVVDHRDVVLAHSDPTRVSTPFSALDAGLRPGVEGKMPVIHVEAAIAGDDDSLGKVFIGLSSEPVVIALQESRDHLFWMGLLVLTLGVVVVLMVSRYFMRPVGDLSAAMLEVASGNLDVQVSPGKVAEWTHLGVCFNGMVNRLKGGYKEMGRGSIEMAKALMAAIDEREFAYGHSERVTDCALQIGRRMGLDDVAMKELEWAAILHDIGRIGVGMEVLSKPGHLNEQEIRLMQRHPEIGKRILEKVDFLRPIAPYVHCHHEFLDGRGYPQGLKGEKIPLISRIITVADAFDAMSSDQPYRKALSKEEVKRRLLAAKGRQFDPDIVDVFLSLPDEPDS